MNDMLKYLLIALLAVSCVQREPSGVPEDGLVEVHILAPQVYGHQVGSPATKADGENVIGDIDDRLNKDLVPIIDLAEGTTLWLTYERRKTADGVEPKEYDAPVLKSYVVRSAGGGYQALYACDFSKVGDKLVVDADDASTTATPLYLKHDETYRFRMISPALPISQSDLSMHVDNGDSFCSSDQRYTQTSSVDTKIVAAASGVNYISMNPMIQQTARLRFTLKKGTNVSSILMMGDGVEISGIQDPYLHNVDGDNYNWSSMDSADTLVMRLGDKRAWVTLPGERFTTNADGDLVGDICILPTDARSNTVTILLNMAVNGVPTQYITTLNGMVFEHAKSYNMTFTVGLQNNIVVVNWQNVSWTDDI